MSLILGGPDETDETLNQTITRVSACAPTAVVAFLGVRVYPCTPVHGRLLRDGFLDGTEDLLRPLFYVSPQVEPHLLQTAKELKKVRRNWWFPGLEGPSRFCRRARARGVRGPLWELLG